MEHWRPTTTAETNTTNVLLRLSQPSTPCPQHKPTAACLATWRLTSELGAVAIVSVPIIPWMTPSVSLASPIRHS